MIWFTLWILAGLACKAFGHYSPEDYPGLIPILVLGPFCFVGQTWRGFEGWYFSYTQPRGFWPGLSKDGKP